MHIVLSEPINFVLLDLLKGFGGVDAMFNAQSLVCGCGNGAWKFTPQARVIYLVNKRVKTVVSNTLTLLVADSYCKLF
jgi:hypothetical protein